MKKFLFIVGVSLLLAGVVGVEKNVHFEKSADINILDQESIDDSLLRQLNAILKEGEASGSDSECESSDSSFENSPESDLLPLSIFSICGGLFTLAVLAKQVRNDFRQIISGQTKVS